ncbi:malonate-semialdehyde dehydrogenase (acetylating)/methylmalonate-semialdehyde dehydrogenase [Glaciihabitans tibetensis]|uniref:methylmalonate-semialdehyde dehydrogenase (CoA acylating) n=1 Tax=Glaciihabitans tibetensis TaxID=1266600 RepID=A0A2T0V6Q3_9MICO|nr:CoA-acylating methylmalonate-semialdehyde dehydrogenase [Glaciihabitans tibetensis]PRY65853.1 malonate-semialdehyde dehydrogenase (acetylating)/methylmalonate-semialdehyde dehydrogenase [Glaciihabitans tibetensis]
MADPTIADPTLADPTTAGPTLAEPTSLPIVQHWINGATAVSSSGRVGPVFNPALGEQTKSVALADAAEVDAAVAAAVAAFPAWRDMSITKRQQILFSFRELLNARKGELADILTSEHGKVLTDSAGEITRGLEVVELATGFPHLVKGEYSSNVSTGVDVYSTKAPLGVVGIISPFNFPAMVPMWFFPIAIAAGNTVVLKPSEKDPSAAIWLAELFAEAGLPAGVFNVVHGDKVAVDGLLEHPDVKAISFVGSTPIAQYIYSTAAANGKRVQALGGAKNHMLVLPDADLDLAADAAINAGFGSAGERCMAISVVVAVEPVADALISKITERMSRLTIGDGRRNCDMGPLVTEAHRDKVASYIELAASDGATVVVDGRGVQVDGAVDGAAGGFWLGPTLLDKVSVTSKVYLDEIFGPVLSVVRVASYEDGVALINNSRYGNGTAIFTNDGGAARRFQDEIEVGMVGINVPIPVPVAYYSFGGFKDSLFGSNKAYGIAGFDFYTREKAVTSRWLDPSHGGINLGFPQN